MTLLAFLLLLLTGIVAGIIGTIFGIGGGLILVPVLVLGFDLPMHQAVAASLIAVIATSGAGASVYVRNGMANIRLGVALEGATSVGAIIGGFAANALSSDALEKIFAAFLILIGSFLWIRRRMRTEGAIQPPNDAGLNGHYTDEQSSEEVHYGVRRLRTGIVVSLLAGNVSGMMGVGGGIIKVPVMHAICGIPLKVATATSNFMIGVTALAGAVIFLAHGHVHPLFTAAAVLGVLGGSLLGTRIARRLRSRTILLLFILLLYLTAVRMWVS